jgi:hypothetical protein
MKPLQYILYGAATVCLLTAACLWIYTDQQPLNKEDLTQYIEQGQSFAHEGELMAEVMVEEKGISPYLQEHNKAVIAELENQRDQLNQKEVEEKYSTQRTSLSQRIAEMEDRFVSIRSHEHHPESLETDIQELKLLDSHLSTLKDTL